ncbi:MAG: c-type cytochrome [Pseudomonadota bacterium]
MSDNSNPYGAPDTGHVWDDNLRELTNDPPKWWMIGFHASWILVLVYGLIYPMWPMLTTHTKGFTGWTSIGEYKEDLKAIEEQRAEYEGSFQALLESDPEGAAATILADTNSDLYQYVKRSGKVLFGDNCAACHGSNGQGNPNYPSLIDDDWLYGGSVAKIEETIVNGRNGIMPSHADRLTDAEADELTDAVMAGDPTSTPLYQQKGCFACHGPDGSGNQMLGAANLTDSIWRFAAEDQRASVKHTILYGVNDTQYPDETRNAEMPKFGGGKLSETDIKKLAIYVKQFDVGL